ncbi:AraC family transcriptional regulator [Aquabacterium sp. CECT 9606]|uniref:AraC family transcriptional regulator n=1 Tax=Aquabacterium sp. CECT 9606 TaxID=2845822 RepID=UPI001E436CA0|nr:AraC family transcriptional regulator [Aquabacterium sp. CECT 9606]
MPTQYIHQIADQVTRMGARLPDWFLQLLHPGANGELDVQHLSFEAFQRLVREAMALTSEPAFGLLVGESLLVNSHGILGYAAANSQTLRQALGVIERYLLLRTSLLAIQQEASGKQLRLVFVEPHPLGDVRAAVLEAVVLTVKKLIDYVTMGTCQVSCVVFPFEQPAHAALAHELFDCAVRYDASWCGLELPAAQLDQPLQTGNPQAWLDAVQRCQEEMSRLQRQQALSIRVRQLMLSKPGGFPSLQVTARLLNLTPRTLHRRLQDEGSSYRDLLEDTRHRLAIDHLKAGRLTMQEIAFMLGYDDLANFRRAFKRWEGVAPTTFRNRVTSQPRNRPVVQK